MILLPAASAFYLAMGRRGVGDGAELDSVGGKGRACGILVLPIFNTTNYPTINFS
jgi:hypothetical protein